MPFITNAELERLRRELSIAQEGRGVLSGQLAELRQTVAPLLELQASVNAGEWVRRGEPLAVQLPASIAVTIGKAQPAASAPIEAEEPLSDDVLEACRIYAFPGSLDFRRDFFLNKAEARKLQRKGASDDAIIKHLHGGKGRKAAPGPAVMSELDRGGVIMDGEIDG